MKKFDLKNYIRKIWHFLWYDDSLLSLLANLVLAFILIKFIILPGVGFMLSTNYPVVAIVSGSMQHHPENGNLCGNVLDDFESRNLELDQWWLYCGDYYENELGITKNQFNEFDYKDGLNIGDIIIIYGKNSEDIEIGDVLVFKPQDEDFYERMGPVIHRLVDKWEEDGDYYFKTKGDNNPEVSNNFEDKIPEENVEGVATVRIPYLGYLKVIFNEIVMFFRG